MHHAVPAVEGGRHKDERTHDDFHRSGATHGVNICVNRLPCPPVSSSISSSSDYTCPLRLNMVGVRQIDPVQKNGKGHLDI